MKISQYPAITKIIPINKLMVLSAAVCALMLACTNSASAVTLGFFDPVTLTGDSHVVGTVSPGAPASPDKVKDYINFMITLGVNTTVTHNFGQPEGIQTIYRTTNLFGSLPTASDTGAVSGTGTTINLNLLGTFTYLFAKYDGQNDLSEVWNIADLTGVLTIPQNGPLGHGLSGWILFGPGGTNNTPDGGTTAALLGLGLAGLAGLRAKFGRH